MDGDRLLAGLELEMLAEHDHALKAFDAAMRDWLRLEAEVDALPQPWSRSVCVAVVMSWARVEACARAVLAFDAFPPRPAPAA